MMYEQIAKRPSLALSCKQGLTNQFFVTIYLSLAHLTMQGIRSLLFLSTELQVYRNKIINVTQIKRALVCWLQQFAGYYRE